MTPLQSGEISERFRSKMYPEVGARFQRKALSLRATHTHTHASRMNTCVYLLGGWVVVVVAIVVGVAVVGSVMLMRCTNSVVSIWSTKITGSSKSGPWRPVPPFFLPCLRWSPLPFAFPLPLPLPIPLLFTLPFPCPCPWPCPLPCTLSCSLTPL